MNINIRGYCVIVMYSYIVCICKQMCVCYLCLGMLIFYNYNTTPLLYHLYTKVNDPILEILR